MRKRRWTTGEKPPDSKPFQSKHPVGGAVQQHRLIVLNVRALVATLLLLLLCLGTTTTACPANSSLLHRRDGAIYAVSPVYLSPFVGAAQGRGLNEVEEQKKRKDLLQAVLLQPHVPPAFGQNGVDALNGERPANEAHHHVLTTRNAIRPSTLQFPQEKPVQLHLKPRSQNSNNGHGRHGESHHKEQVIHKGHKDDGRKSKSKHTPSSDHKKPEHHKAKDVPNKAFSDMHHKNEHHNRNHHKLPEYHGQLHKSPVHGKAGHQDSHQFPPHHQQNKPSGHSDKDHPHRLKSPSHVEPHRAQSAHGKQQPHHPPPHHKAKQKPTTHHSSHHPRHPHHPHHPAHPSHRHKTIHRPVHHTSHHFHQLPHHHKPTHQPVHKEPHHHQLPSPGPAKATRATRTSPISAKSTIRKATSSGIVTSEKTSGAKLASSGAVPQLSTQSNATRLQTNDLSALTPSSVVRGALSLESDLSKTRVTSSPTFVSEGNGPSQITSKSTIASPSSQSPSTSKDELSTQQLPGARPDEKSSTAIPNVTTSGNSAAPRTAFSSSKSASLQDTKATLKLLIPTQASGNDNGASDAVSQPASGQQVGPSDKISGAKNDNNSPGGAPSAKEGPGSPTSVDGPGKDKGTGVNLDPITGGTGSTGDGNAGKDTKVKGNTGNSAAGTKTGSTSGTAEAGPVGKDGPAGKDSNAGEDPPAGKDVSTNNDGTALANGAKDSKGDNKAVGNAGNRQGPSQDGLGGIAGGSGGKPGDTGSSSSDSGTSAGGKAGSGGGSSISTSTGSNTSGQGTSSSGGVTLGGGEAGEQSPVSGEGRPSTSGSEGNDNSAVGQGGQASTAAEADSSEDSPVPTEVEIQPGQPETIEAEPLPASESEASLPLEPEDSLPVEPETLPSPQPGSDVGDGPDASLPEETEGIEDAPFDVSADVSGTAGDISVGNNDTPPAEADPDEVPPPEEPEAVLDPLVEMSALEKTEEEGSGAGAGAGDDAGSDTDTAAGGKDGGGGNEDDPADPPEPDDGASIDPVELEPESDLLSETAPEEDAQVSGVDAPVAAPDVGTDLPVEDGAEPVDVEAPAEPGPENPSPEDSPAEEPGIPPTEDELEASPLEDETEAPPEEGPEAQSPADEEPAPAPPPPTPVVPISFMAGEFTHDTATAACPLAAITSDSEAEAFALTGGAGAWIASWNGDDYAGSCLALEAVGSIGIPAGGCDGPFGILCAGNAPEPAVAQDAAPVFVPDPPDEEPAEPSTDVEAEAIEDVPADEPVVAEAADAEDEAPESVDDDEETEAEDAPEEEDEDIEAGDDEAEEEDEE